MIGRVIKAAVKGGVAAAKAKKAGGSTQDVVAAGLTGAARGAGIPSFGGATEKAISGAVGQVASRSSVFHDTRMAHGGVQPAVPAAKHEDDGY
jgi:hypothetical protein